MKGLALGRLLVAAAGLSIVAACGGVSGGVPSAPSASQGAQSRIGDAATLKLSGEYKGKFSDGAYGTGSAKASYSQYKNGVGGILNVKYAKSSVSLSVALVANGSSVDGTTVAGAGSLYCTFATTSTYDAKTHVMSGSYKATYGCSGDQGTFSLKQQCYYKGTGGGADVRPASGPKPC